jgi:hypothetical protein
MSMKKLLVLVTLGAAIAAPNFARAAAATADSHARASNQEWSSRAHVYAPNHYAPSYESYGNANLNPDRELGSNEE